MNIIKTNHPNENQITDMHTLAGLCHKYDNTTLSVAVDSDEEIQYYLLYQDSIDNSTPHLISMLSVSFFDDTCAECIAFTHPQYRNQGHFSSLLDYAMEHCKALEDCDILFPVSNLCPDTMAVLDAIGAEAESEEHQMELILSEANLTCTDNGFSLQPSKTYLDEENSPETTEWFLYQTSLDSKLQLGCCQTSVISDTAVCLHHVEIFPAYRQKGYGTVLMDFLIQKLQSLHFKRIILQVSGDNHAALVLYKKKGFRITETLSYYLY